MQPITVRQSTDALTLVIGPASAILGFLLAAVRDAMKEGAARRRREHAAFRILDDEIRTNKLRAENNQTLLEFEIQSLKDEQAFPVHEPDELRRGAWSLVQQELPQRLAERSDLLTKFTRAASLADEVNQALRARALYKATMQAMGRFGPTLIEYDRVVSAAEGRIIPLLAELESSLQELKE